MAVWTLRLSVRVQGRKPNGYWDRLANVQKEIDMFCNERDLPNGIVPSLAEFRRANRFDLKHAVERWGGLREVADLLEYDVRHTSLSCPTPVADSWCMPALLLGLQG